MDKMILAENLTQTGEIFFCDIYLRSGSKEIKLEKQVYKHTTGTYPNKKGKGERLEVIKINIISSLGFENKK